MTWDVVAADGTDPELLARVVGLSGDAAGRAAVAGALATPDGLLSRQDQLAVGVLPQPTAAQRATAERALRVWSELGTRVALRGDPTWPARLERSPAPPPWLAWRGPARLPSGPAVAVVGARRATPYGTGVAAWLAESAAAAGVTVVSGGAVGIDAAAHGAAADRATTVVLGCGHDVAYPRAHARRGGLFPRVLAGGGALVSELLPGAAPRPHHVRARNRIVAALVDVVVVVEGGDRSGSLVTATDAGEAGVPVLAVPGDVRAPGSAAPHQLLREGAGPCATPADLLGALPLAARPSTAPVDDRRGPSVLPGALAAALAAAWPRPLRVDRLAERCDLPVASVLAAVTRGRVAGEVSESPDGIRLSSAPGADDE